jgi:hypothetical protein
MVGPPDGGAVNAFLATQQRRGGGAGKWRCDFTHRAFGSAQNGFAQRRG